jgi:hypothetical protein
MVKEFCQFGGVLVSYDIFIEIYSSLEYSYLIAHIDIPPFSGIVIRNVSFSPRKGRFLSKGWRSYLGYRYTQGCYEVNYRKTVGKGNGSGR